MNLIEVVLIASGVGVCVGLHLVTFALLRLKRTEDGSSQASSEGSYSTTTGGGEVMLASSARARAKKRAIGPAGTTARLAVGFVFLAKGVFFGTDSSLQWQEVSLGLILAPAVVVLWQFLRLRWNRSQLRATGPIGVALTAAVGLVLISIDFTSDATFVFIGTSMLLAATRGYAGCEVLAIGNWILRRNDQVGCLLFFPVDAIERASRTEELDPRPLPVTTSNQAISSSGW